MQTYVVSSGDTLYGIASKYGVSVNDIKTANNLKNNNLSIGQILKIPTTETVALYIVKKGDSLYSIAKRYDTTVDELIKLNNLKSNSLSVGQQLKLPINGSVSDGEYIVVAGDSLYSIAKKFNISVDELKKLNNLTSNNLSVGQKLKVPNSSQEEVGEYQLYTFGTGDSLAAIAEVYGLTLEELMRLNNLDSPNVEPGTIIRLPMTSVQLMPLGAECFGEGYVEPSYITHVVKRGDSLYVIAKQYGVSVDSIIKLNDLKNNNLSIGQILKIKEVYE